MQDLFEGIFLSFNLKNVLFSFILLVIYSLLIALFSFIARENLQYFATYPASFVIFIFLVSLLLVSVFDIHLYMLSRNIFHSIRYGLNIDFSSNSHDIYTDSLSILLISSGALLLFFLLLLPVYPMQRLGFVYGGFVSPVLFVLMGGIVFVQVFKNIILAFIAHKQRNVKNTLSGIFRFFRVENLNVAVYSIVISFITTLVYGFFSFILLTAVMLTAASITGLSASSYLTGSEAVISRLQDVLRGFGTAGTGVSFEWSGIVLMGLTFYLIFLFILAYCISLLQSLSTVSVYIMASNPGRSINRNALLVIISLIFALVFFGMLLFIRY